MKNLTKRMIVATMLGLPLAVEAQTEQPVPRVNDPVTAAADDDRGMWGLAGLLGLLGLLGMRRHDRDDRHTHTPIR